MSHTPHELADAFPGDAAAIHRLKESDAHFAALASAKQKDDPKLAATVSRIEGKVNKLQSQKRPPALPIQCAPGQQRMDAVNAGADS